MTSESTELREQKGQPTTRIYYETKRDGIAIQEDADDHAYVDEEDHEALHNGWRSRSQIHQGVRMVSQVAR